MSMISLKNIDLVYKINKEKRIKDILIPGSNKFNDFESDGSVHAIRDLDLEIKDGDRLAIIGHNGAGKSTLLKIMAGIYPPSAGEIIVEGKISSMFELATGFEMEQSGWDNIYLRGLMLGETPKGIKKKMKEIGEFSELGNFLNMPVKYYSSGMFIRLAFSVSTAIHPDILLLDEIVGAGDAAFMSKAKKRMNDMMYNAKIMVLVTHSIHDAINLCNVCVWLERGVIIMRGTPEAVTTKYMQSINMI